VPLVRIAAVILVLVSSLAFAADKPATDESVKALIAVTESKKLIDDMYPRLDAMMESSMKQATGTATFSPGQQKILDEMRAKMIAMFRDEMRWETMEPEIVAIYKQSFTEDEVRGMLKFYRSKAGKAVIAKMPMVMQGTMTMVQGQLQRMMPRMQQIQEETVNQLQACCADGG
jgi:hypothetical protein